LLATRKSGVVGHVSHLVTFVNPGLEVTHLGIDRVLEVTNSVARHPRGVDRLANLPVAVETGRHDVRPRLLQGTFLAEAGGLLD